MKLKTETTMMIIMGFVMVLVSTVIYPFASWALFFSGLSIITVGLIIDMVVEKFN